MLEKLWSVIVSPIDIPRSKRERISRSGSLSIARPSANGIVFSSDKKPNKGVVWVISILSEEVKFSNSANWEVKISELKSKIRSSFKNGIRNVVMTSQKTTNLLDVKDPTFTFKCLDKNGSFRSDLSFFETLGLCYFLLNFIKNLRPINAGFFSPLVRFAFGWKPTKFTNNGNPILKFGLGQRYRFGNHIF